LATLFLNYYCHTAITLTWPVYKIAFPFNWWPFFYHSFMAISCKIVPRIAFNGSFWSFWPFSGASRATNILSSPKRSYISNLKSLVLKKCISHCKSCYIRNYYILCAERPRSTTLSFQATTTNCYIIYNIALFQDAFRSC